MRRQLFLGIDIGTQSTRVALVDALGKVVASYSEGYALNTPFQGWAEQDPELWWQAVLRGIAAVQSQADVKAGEILAIGCDSQMHATIPLGFSGELLSHSVQLWCDKRGSQLVEKVKSDAYLPTAIQKAGSAPVPAWWGFKILWMKENQPEVYQKTWKFVTGSGFINYRLTGECSIDWSEASGAFLMDVTTLDWSTELAELLQIDLEKLPPIFRSSEVIGSVTPQAAALTGLPAGAPVVAGGGDMLTMLVATGLVQRGRAMDVTGTASNLVFFVEQPVLNPPLMNLHHTLEGWCPFGIVESGGGSLRWFRDELAAHAVDARRASSQEVYELLNAKAAQEEPGCGGLLYFPYLVGERILGTPNARGVFFGLTLRTTLGTMARAIMEGITFELRRTLEIVESVGNRVDEVYTTGGGARSAVWSQIKADIYKKPVFTLAADEGGVVGSAILAMLGIGFYADPLTATAHCVQTARVYHPNPRNFDRYDALFGLFKEIHDQLQAPFNRLAAVL